MTQQAHAELPTKTRDDLPDSAFLWIGPDGQRHLPYRHKDGSLDLDHLRNAASRVDEVAGMPEDARSRVKARIEKLLAEQRQAADSPGPADVHTNVPIGAIKPWQTAFLKRLRGELKQYVAPEYFADAVRRSRAHVGGLAKAARVKAAQAAMAASEDGVAACWRLDSAVFAEAKRVGQPPEWIPFLPKPGDYLHPSYGEVSMTRERAERFIKNFKEGVYQTPLPLDAEHNLKASGAVGHVVDLRMNEDGSVDARVEWNDLGRSLLADDRFRFFSPEWYERWQHPLTRQVHKDVAIGGALTTRPFFKPGSLRPLAAGEGAADEPDFSADDALAAAVDALLAEGEDEPQSHGEQEESVPDEKKSGEGNAQPPVQMSEDVRRLFDEMKADFTRQMGELKSELEAERGKREAAEKVAGDAAKELRRQKFTGIVRGLGGANDGKPFVGDVAGHVEMLEGLADAFGEDHKLFKAYIDDQSARAEALRKSGVFTEHGRAGAATDASVEDQINAKAKAMCEADPKLTLEAARVKVLGENPQLYAEFQKNHQGVA